LKKRGVLILMFVSALAIAGLGTAYACLGMNASTAGAVTVTIDGDSAVYMCSGASIPLSWGSIQVGDNTQTITITNNGNTNLKPHLTASSSLPTGWTLTCSLENQPIPKGESATGTLTLNIPAHTPSGSYSWHAGITLTHTK
jgi:hypothetical protein